MPWEHAVEKEAAMAGASSTGWKVCDGQGLTEFDFFVIKDGVHIPVLIVDPVDLETSKAAIDDTETLIGQVYAASGTIAIASYAVDVLGFLAGMANCRGVIFTNDVLPSHTLHSYVYDAGGYHPEV